MINDAHYEHELCQCIVWAYQNEARLLDKLMVKSFKTPHSKLIGIAVNYFTIQQICEQISNSTKSIDAIWQDKQQSGRGQDGHRHTQLSYPECGNCIRHVQPGCTHCPTKDMKCNKISHWNPKYQGGKPPPKTDDLQRGQHRTWWGTPKRHSGQNKRTDAIDVGYDDSPQDEIMKLWNQPQHWPHNRYQLCWNHHWQHNNRPQQSLHKCDTPSTCCNKLHKASIRVKVDTGAGGNILPLWLFHQGTRTLLPQHRRSFCKSGMQPTSNRNFQMTLKGLDDLKALDALWVNIISPSKLVPSQLYTHHRSAQ